MTEDPFSKIIKAKDLAKSAHAMVTIHGKSGTGKTTIGARCDDVPLILLTEENGKPFIDSANPNADVWMIETLQDYYDAMSAVGAHLQAARVNKTEPKWNWVVLDSFTDLQMMFVAFLKEQRSIAAKTGKKARSKSAPLTQNEWGYVSDWTQLQVKKIGLLKANKLVLCLQKRIDPDEDIPGDELEIGPQLYSPVARGVLCSNSHLVGMSVKSKKPEKFQIMFHGSDQFRLKGHPNINPLEDQDINAVLKKLYSPVDPSVYEQKPDPEKTETKTTKTKKRKADK